MDEKAKAAATAASGGILGGAVTAVIGNAGLTIAGTAVSIGAPVFIGAGLLLGLAGYGVYAAVKKSSNGGSRRDE